MCTTRELVAQNLAVLRRMAKYTQITSTSTAEDGEGTAGARGRTLVEQVGPNVDITDTSRQKYDEVMASSWLFRLGLPISGCWLLWVGG